MNERFRPLASMLREARAPRHAVTPDPAPLDPPALDGAAGALCDEIAIARVAVYEVYERACARLLEALARDVLARELALAPVDIALLTRRALATFADEEPVALIVAPADAERLVTDVPVRTDESLERGDLVVAVRDGFVDARFKLRLQACLMQAVL